MSDFLTDQPDESAVVAPYAGGLLATEKLTKLRRLRTGIWMALYIAMVLVVAHGSLYVQGLLMVAAVFGALALGQDMAMGMLGLYSLGQAGLFATGAYLTAVLVGTYKVNVGLLLVVSIFVCGLIGAFLGSLSLRVSGLYFAITTLIFTIVVTSVIEHLGVTGGYSGIAGPTFPAFPAAAANILGTAQVWIVMAVLALAIILSVGVRKSPFFVAMLATRDVEVAAEAAGVPTRRIKVWVFSLAAALAGAAGWAFSSLGFISPGQFDWSVSVNIMIMVLLGGINSVLGPLIGAAFITIFPAYVTISGLWEEVLFGGILLLVVIVSPDGVLGIVRRAVGRARLLRSRDKSKGSNGLSVASIAAGTDGSNAPVNVKSHPFVKLIRGGEPAERAPAAISCRSIKYRYGAEHLYALGGVDLEIPQGRIHGLIGANGSGKSTLVDVIAGRRVPEEGHVLIRGLDVTRLPARSRPGLGVMRTFQHAQLVNELTLTDNVLLGLYHQIRLAETRGFVWPLLPASRREMEMLRQKARRCLEEVGLGAWSDRLAADAPHGVVQLTQIAITEAAGADILLLDEPLAGLSTNEVARVLELLKAMRSNGKTILLIEHQVGAMAELADEVTVLDAGMVVIEGPAGATLRSREVREVYLGASG